MPQQARLKVHGHGGVEVELLTAYLGAFKHAYDSILFFEATMDAMNRAARDFPFPRSILASDFLLSRRIGGRVRYSSSTPEEIAAAVPRKEQLILSAVSLHSPGFWEFMGTLNPLEVLRKYLNDRHERRKDHTYRETAERRRLALENLILEDRVIADRVRIAKDLGATDRDLAPLLNELINRPLMGLDRYQDRGVIDHAEIPRISSHEDE